MNWHRLRKWRKTIHHLCNSIFVELNFKHCSIRKEYNLNRTFMDSIIACHVSTWSLCQMSTDRIALTYRSTASYYTVFHRVSVDVGWKWKGSVTSVPQVLDYVHETQYTPYINSVRYKPTLTYWLYSQFWNKHVEAARVPVHGHHNHLTATTTAIRLLISVPLWGRCGSFWVVLVLPGRYDWRDGTDRIAAHTL